MYIVDAAFECYSDTTMSAAQQAITTLIDAWRYSGQIMGREITLLLKQQSFVARVMCPEPQSLQPQFDSPFVKKAKTMLTEAGLLAPKVKVQGEDILAHATAPDLTAPFYILYTSYVQSCSPLQCGSTLQPIPLYRIPAVANGDQKAIIKWQEDWQACDQLQMNGATGAEWAALAEMADLTSTLFIRGRDLAKRLSYLCQKPVYYYQYRVGGESVEQEHNRACPSCGSAEWRLVEPLHQLFDFKCDSCRLLSNISWDFQ